MSTGTDLIYVPVTTGTGQAFLPGGHRTGAPGKHVVRGKAKYRLVDEKVRVFVAPPIQALESSAVRVSIPLATFGVLTVRRSALPSLLPSVEAIRLHNSQNGGLEGVQQGAVWRQASSRRPHWRILLQGCTSCPCRAPRGAVSVPIPMTYPFSLLPSTSTDWKARLGVVCISGTIRSPRLAAPLPLSHLLS